MIKTFTLDLGLYIQLAEAVDNNEITPQMAKVVLKHNNMLIPVIDPQGNQLSTMDLDKYNTRDWLIFVLCQVSQLSLTDYLNKYGDTSNHVVKVPLHISKQDLKEFN